MAPTVSHRRRRYQAYKRLINSLSNEPDSYIRSVVQKGKRPLIEALALAALAVLHRRIKLSKAQAKKITVFEKTLKKLQKAKTIQQKKTQLQTGGFLSALIPIIAPAVLGLLGKLTR